MLRNHYEVLDIPRTSSSASIDSVSVKRAYRQALLRHHPDKTAIGRESEHPTESVDKKGVPSVDEITLAYQTLSDPKARLEYDRGLRLVQENEAVLDKPGDRSVGLEVVDLDDMEYDEARELWGRGCRCGTSGGFTVNEDDLEMAIDRMEGGNSYEILIGCAGCSLCLKVHFAVAEAT